MPELPEVETTRRGLAPHLQKRIITHLDIRQPKLRWPVPMDLDRHLCHMKIHQIRRRGKYLLLETGNGSLIIHLGMSGSLRIAGPDSAGLGKHDHVVFHLDNHRRLIFHDPRRFGALLWTDAPPEEHPLLKSLGPEPFDHTFNGSWLQQMARSSRGTTIKTLIMNQKIVAGIGNIYANEALFAAGIRPDRIANTIPINPLDALCKSVRNVLSAAIAQGGTTLRDFTNEKGQPGYFQLALNVYGKDGSPCPNCCHPIQATRIGQRATFFCPRCQR